MPNSADEMNLLGELHGIPAGDVGPSHGINTCGSVKQTAAFSANMIALLTSQNHFSVFSSSPNTRPDFLASKMKGKKITINFSLLSCSAHRVAALLEECKINRTEYAVTDTGRSCSSSHSISVMALFSIAAKSCHYRLLRLESSWSSPVPWWCSLCLALNTRADCIAWLQLCSVSIWQLNFPAPPPHEPWNEPWDTVDEGDIREWFGKT